MHRAAIAPTSAFALFGALSLTAMATQAYAQPRMVSGPQAPVAAPWHQADPASPAGRKRLSRPVRIVAWGERDARGAEAADE